MCNKALKTLFELFALSGHIIITTGYYTHLLQWSLCSFYMFCITWKRINHRLLWFPRSTSEMRSETILLFMQQLVSIFTLAMLCFVCTKPPSCGYHVVICFLHRQNVFCDVSVWELLMRKKYVVHVIFIRAACVWFFFFFLFQPSVSLRLCILHIAPPAGHVYEI